MFFIKKHLNSNCEVEKLLQRGKKINQRKKEKNQRKN